MDNIQKSALKEGIRQQDLQKNEINTKPTRQQELQQHGRATRPVKKKSNGFSVDVNAMMSYHTKDIDEEDREVYLHKFLEETRDDMQSSFAQEIQDIYSPYVDIRQNISIPDTINKSEVDFYVRKLLLMNKGGIKLSEEIYLPIAFYFLIAGYYEDGLDFIIRNIDNASDKGLVVNMLAVLFYKNGNKDESLDLLEDFIHHSDGVKEDIVYYNAGLMNYMTGNYKKSILYLEGREDELSSRSNYFLCLGDSYYNMGNPERSALYFEKYLHKNTNNLSVLTKLIDLYYEEENFTRSLKYLSIYEDSEGDMTNLLFKKAVSLYFVDYFDDSMHTLANLLSIDKRYLDGKNRDYLFGLFVEAFRMDLSDEKVFKVFRREMEHQNWNQDMVNYLISQIKNVNIEDPSSLCFLGILNKQTGNTSSAMTIFEKVLSSNPAHTEAMNWLGICHYEIGNSDRAIKIYQQLSLKKSAGKELSYLVSKLFIEREDIHSAKQSALYAYNEGIHNLDILKMIGYIFIELKELETAYEFYMKAQKQDPHNLEVQNQIGVVYLLQGEYNDAAMLFKRIVKVDPSFKEAHYNLGVTYKKMLEEESQSHINRYYELSNENSAMGSDMGSDMGSIEDDAGAEVEDGIELDRHSPNDTTKISVGS